ncbi:glutathione S-transferase 1-like [Cydia splendana]|uniref:glutathione S-transferase 1-like n=1 Tax=Cydia splendana TaxID=1100963 RepID=UPI002143E970
MVKLYKFEVSPPARSCIIACELFNIPVELVEVNYAEGEHLKPEYLKKNPLHTVPVLEDGSVVVNDSHAILMYLADVYGKQESFYPKDPKQRALVNQKLFFNSTILFMRLKNIAYPLFVEGITDIPKKNLDAIEEAYGFLEEFLSRTKYLAGDNITIADISAYATVTGLVVIKELNAQKYPKTQAWVQDLEKRPYVEKGNAKGVEEYKLLLKSKLG